MGLEDGSFWMTEGGVPEPTQATPPGETRGRALSPSVAGRVKETWVAADGRQLALPQLSCAAGTGREAPAASSVW